MKGKRKTKAQRVEIVINICKQLRFFPKSSHWVNESPYIDLYNGNFKEIKQLKQVFHDYINQNDDEPQKLIGFSGIIDFPDIDRKIEYILPVKDSATPLFVLRTTLNN
jgi:hypothetical protein